MEQVIASENSFQIGMALASIATQTNFELATTAPKMNQVAAKAVL
jgi:hypothetical protein